MKEKEGKEWEGQGERGKENGEKGMEEGDRKPLHIPHPLLNHFSSEICSNNSVRQANNHFPSTKNILSVFILLMSYFSKYLEQFPVKSSDLQHIHHKMSRDPYYVHYKLQQI